MDNEEQRIWQQLCSHTKKNPITANLLGKLTANGDDSIGVPDGREIRKNEKGRSNKTRIETLW